MAQGRRRQLGGVDRLPSGRWRVRLLDPGTGRRVSIGSFKTKAEAERAFASAVTDQQKGAWVAPEKGRVTLDDYAWQWLDTRLSGAGGAASAEDTGAVRRLPPTAHPADTRSAPPRPADHCRHPELARRTAR